MTTRETHRSGRTYARVAAAGALTAGVLALAPLAHAAPPPAVPAPPAAGLAAAHDAAASSTTLDTLSRFFARDGALAKGDAKPRIEGAAVPVYALSPDFVAGKRNAPVATLEFLASKAVSADGQKASVWTAGGGTDWKVVNIATGDDETRYAAEGAKKLSGGTVFREPQVNAWYVQRADRVLPLNTEAVRAVGARGTTVDAYRDRVHKAYGDKLPGSAYAKKGLAGGYGTEAQARPADASAPLAAEPVGSASDSVGTTTLAASAGGAALALGLGTVAVRRLRRR
ncbi:MULTISPECIES: hypothetical protein [Streptomyces]|uniref:hypothetical protein n=1 Tax=Streptomyces TaxID=1883 RepID=UPI00163D0FCF|nr:MULTISPECIES: hypothetical protein [Streptomyces]MBC2877184.1 hypothetical protein [Streptomyces sp. TYQ1024]UBI39451.1 hypothetical protein K7I03_25285 [Streptomyces mobaraensis]UKW32031.1 hypothetical protein MCU78_25220 [Streptomyces sp. TYQ1024]